MSANTDSALVTKSIFIASKQKCMVSSRCVLMAVYHGDHVSYLEAALLSTLVPEIDRVLVGVDGPISKELTSVLQQIATSDSRVEVMQFTYSRGLANVLNDLIDNVLEDPCCDLIFRMDADDICLPARFNSQIKFFAENPHVDVLGGNAEIINKDGIVCGKIYKSPNNTVLKHRLSFDSPFVHPTVAIRACLLRKGYRYPTNTIRFEDVAFWAQLALAGANFANLTIPILRYRLTGASIQRRAGWQKVFNETLVRFGYLLRTAPQRLDVLFLIILIAMVKLFMPIWVLVWIQSMRMRILG